ncbi:unnamed protein product [Closterium sp. NIES-64]|nr:unnamed protein product [Closterium sp. NIES-64]
MPEEITSPRATSYEAPRDVPTCGRHDPDRVASSRVVDDNALDDDDGNSDYNEYAVGTDDEADSGEEPDKGMSDSEEDGEGDKSEDEDDAPEESLPAASNTRAGRAKPAAPAKTASKGGDPPRRAPKTRNHMPVKRSVWSLLESTIFVAARWFMEDELESLLGKQGSQYWARLINHLEKENPGPNNRSRSVRRLPLAGDAALARARGARARVGLAGVVEVAVGAAGGVGVAVGVVAGVEVAVAAAEAEAAVAVAVGAEAAVAAEVEAAVVEEVELVGVALLSGAAPGV